MGVAPIANHVEFKIVSTKINDRRRSRITQRKAFDISTYNSIPTTPIFAKKAQEFASEWFTRCNNKELPTPRQIIQGLSIFYSLLIEKEAEGTGKSRVKSMKETYQKVFDIIQNLLAFDDLDKKFFT